MSDLSFGEALVYIILLALLASMVHIVLAIAVVIVLLLAYVMAGFIYEHPDLSAVIVISVFAVIIVLYGNSFSLPTWLIGK